MASPLESEAASPGKEEIRRELSSLPERVRSAFFNAEISQWLETPDLSWKSPTTFCESVEVVIKGDRLYEKREEIPDTGSDRIYIRTGDTVRLWRREPGSDKGIIRKLLPQEIDIKTRFIFPWTDMRLRYGFDPAKTEFRVEGREEHRGMPSVRISWKGEEGENCSALLSTKHGYLPLYLEKREEDEVISILDVVSLSVSEEGVALPEEMVTKSWLSLFFCRQMLGEKDLPPDDIQADFLVNITRFEASGIEINPTVSEAFFQMNWGEKTEIDDQIKNGPELPEGLTASVTPTPTPTPPPARPSTHSSWVLSHYYLILFIAALIAVLYVMFRPR